MQMDKDLSNACLVLTSDRQMWRQVFRPATSIPSVRDGRSLVPTRIDPQDVDDLLGDEGLELLEHAAVVVVDLVGVEPDVFSLLMWYARARPQSVLLLRRGAEPLSVDARDFNVHSYDAGDGVSQRRARMMVADLCLQGANARNRAQLNRASITTINGSRSLRRRRQRNGVSEALRVACRALVAEDLSGARAALAEALHLERDAPDLLLRSALLHRRAGRWGDAAPALRAAVAQDPDLAPAWRELGIVYQRTGEAGAAEALRTAIRLTDDFEACIALALLLARRGENAESTALLDKALRASGGQLNLVLPALVRRVARDHRIHMLPWERERVQDVLEIRAGQTQAEPAEDVPWSFFDAARAHLLLEQPEAALGYAQRGAAHITAGWQRDTFGEDLDVFGRAGIEVQPLRDALGIQPKHVQAERAQDDEPSKVFQAAARDPSWYVENVPCMAACPVGTDAGAYVHLLAERRYEEAFRVARGPNPFASVCARICAAPCEDACRRGNIDEPVEIRSLKRFLTERHGVEGFDARIDEALSADGAPCIEGPAYASHLKKLSTGRATGKRIAIVGGGPAGLACAHDLAVLGHDVTIYEAAHQLGGMMRQGIPIYRLSRDVLELEIGAILSLGIRVELGTGLNAERTLGSLFEAGLDAAFLASGAGRGRYLEAEGAELDGVVRAIDFLLNANAGYRMDMGKRVLVVGGGNVALDVARTARLGRAPDRSSHGAARQDAAQTFGEALPAEALRSALKGGRRIVNVIARQPMGEWPAQRTVRGTEELAHAQEEGIIFHPLRGVRRFLGSNGKVTAVELAEVVQLYDEDGAYAPRYGAHAAETIPCDTVFLAVGQEPELDYLEGTAEIRRTRRGLIEVDPESLATSMPGVYAGGDAAFGPRTLIEAVSDGKRAARHIHEFLSPGPQLDVEYAFEEVHPRAVPTSHGYDLVPRMAPACTAVGRRTGISEVEHAYEEDEAVEQASRCLVCHVQTVYDGDLCIACGRCTDVCPFSCLSFVTPDDVELVSEGVGSSDAGQVFMIKDEDECIRCGLCAERCPTGAMTMERFETTVEAASAATEAAAHV